MDEELIKPAVIKIVEIMLEKGEKIKCSAFVEENFNMLIC